MKAVAKVTVVLLIVIGVGIGILATRTGAPNYGSVTGIAFTSGGPFGTLRRAISGMKVEVTGTAPPMTFTTESNRLGRFSFSLQPGTYTIRACGQSRPVVVRAGRTTVANCGVEIR
jgi:hypothetical protein